MFRKISRSVTLIWRSGPYATTGGALPALAAACALVLQLLFTSVAFGAPAANGGEAGYTISCTALNGGSAGEKNPVAPAGAHRHGHCCFLHSAALLGPAPRQAANASFTPPVGARFFVRIYERDALRGAPELALSAPRAPPEPSID